MSITARALLIACLAMGCNDNAEGSDVDASVPSASASAPVPGERVRALREAEVRRKVDAVGDEDLASRDVEVRRAAARALARAQSPAAREGLLRLLSDEDEDVVAWAAYGLGDHCTGQREATVSALVAAAAARSAERAKGKLSAMGAIARAVGRCASPQSEPTLTGWARRRDAHSVDAIFALGDVATQQKKLREETFVALLEMAAGTAAHPALPDALYPFGRVDNVPPSVVDRALEVAKARIKDKQGPGRLYAMRTLGRCNDAAAPVLEEVLKARGSYTAAERVEAARGLGRLGRNGQRALGAALEKLFPPEGLDKKTLASPETGVLLTAITAITDMRDGARRTLERIAALPAPTGASAAQLRRISWLRCSAATLVVEREFEKPLLMACDLGVPENKRVHPLPGSIGSRAVVLALGIDGVKINGKRLQVWRSYATGGNVRSRTAAIELIGTHDELGDAAADVLAAALSAKEEGLVGTAAQVIAKHPERVRVETKKGTSTVDVRVTKALLAALAKPGRDLEALSDVVQAVGALGLDDGKKRLLELCSSPHAVLRDKSHAALARLLGGASKVRCKPHKPLPAPAELDHVVNKPVRIELDSDAGKLTLELDPELAPIAVTRVADLVKSGFYNNMVVHRVVPAFVSQFGSPTADGYGGAPGKPALPCETSPISYRTGSVGVALAGRDTGGSQLFVSHVPTPHLDGKYALLGKGGGAWDALVDGDVIRKARIVE